MTFCKKCGDYYFNVNRREHSCKEFTVEIENYGEVTARATTLDSALEKIAENYNDEGDLIDNEIIAVYEDKKFILSAELDIEYRVKEI